MDSLPERDLQIKIDRESVAQEIVATRVRWRFTHAASPRLLQLTEKFLAVNILPPYPGWEIMSKIICEAWGQSAPILKPTAISRIGLRYINRIEKPGNGELSQWIKPNDFVAPVVLRTENGFLSRVQAQLKPGHQGLVTLGEQGNAIIFDIDRIREESLQPECDILRVAVEDLHQGVWDIFATAIGPRLEQYLQGRD